MIALSRTSKFTLTISRQFEFSRLQDQTLACAYEALIPVVSRRPERFQTRRSNARIVPPVARSHRPSAVGG
jgi:hypothetical protein